MTSISCQICADEIRSEFKTGDVDLPYIERGELKNALPAPAPREPSPAEQAIQKIYEAPVRPTIIDNKPGIEYHYPNR